MNKSTNQTKIRILLIILASTLAILAVFGIILYSTGFRYIKTENVKFIGKIKDGMPHSGKIVYDSGIKGKLLTDKNGNKEIKYSTGDVYTGELDGVVRNGYGKIVYSDGSVYEGDFSNNERTGNAIIRYASGDCYEGEVKSGIPDGFGKYTLSNGSCYYGEFSSGLKNGVGAYIGDDGSYYYGGFKDDMRHGSGNYSVPLPDGTVYNGECKQFFVGGDIYTGDFVNDARTGKGKYIWASGETYEGNFNKGKFNGTGTYTFADGEEYTGEFVDGHFPDEKKDADVTPNNKQNDGNS